MIAASNTGETDTAGAGMAGPGEAEAVPAARLHLPSWRDGRLLLGVALLLASVAVGARVVAAADDTVPVYAARDVLPTGSPLTPDRLVVARVHLSGTDARYLDARRPPPADGILLRGVGRGELVPTSAVGSAALLSTRPVSVPLDGAVPEGLVAGGLVDVWASPRRRETGTAAAFGTPRLLAQQVEVFHVTEPGDGLSVGRQSAVELLLRQTELPLVLDALANGARTSVVPVPGPARSGRPS